MCGLNVSMHRRFRKYEGNNSSFIINELIVCFFRSMYIHSGILRVLSVVRIFDKSTGGCDSMCKQSRIFLMRI